VWQKRLTKNVVTSRKPKNSPDWLSKNGKNGNGHDTLRRPHRHRQRREVARVVVMTLTEETHSVLIVALFVAPILLLFYAGVRHEQKPAREAKKQADRERKLHYQQRREELRQRWAKYQTLTEAEKQQEWPEVYEDEHEEIFGPERPSRVARRERERRTQEFAEECRQRWAEYRAEYQRLTEDEKQQSWFRDFYELEP
jgi:hypothetical protein